MNNFLFFQDRPDPHNVGLIDFERFQTLINVKSYHSPGLDHPGSYTSPVPGILPFIELKPLAVSHELYEKKLDLCLIVLTTHQLDVTRAYFEKQWENQLDKAPLDGSLLKLFKTLRPNWQSEVTNSTQFADYMMKEPQNVYDSLYLAVVFNEARKGKGYEGKFPPLHDMLYLKPSRYQEILKRVKNSNEKCLSLNKKDFVLCESMLEQRYHQIYRDSFAMVVKGYLDKSQELTHSLLQKVLSDPIIKLETPKINYDEINVWHLFGSYSDLSLDNTKKMFKVDDTHPVWKAIEKLNKFTLNLYELTKAYFSKSGKLITYQDNESFVFGLSKLVDDYYVDISKSLSHLTVAGEEFETICQGLKQLTKKIDFKQHLLSIDDVEQLELKEPSVRSTKF